MGFIRQSFKRQIFIIFLAVTLAMVIIGGILTVQGFQASIKAQGHTALLSLTVLENVILPAILYHKEASPEERAKKLLELVGIGNLASAKPNELSGGELRRMAIARAMLLRPDIMLADEPTAGLDNENTLAVLSLLRKAADNGTAVLLITHENEAAQFADLVYTMDGGNLVKS